MSEHNNTNTRRTFLKTVGAKTIGATAVFAGIPNIISAHDREMSVLELRRPPIISPNDKIRFATVGFGGRGMYDTDMALKQAGTELAGTCDVYDGRTTRSREIYGDKLFTTRHYEELLARPDIDAIIIAGTHHWNAKVSIDALKAGKAVYCEKPMVQKIEEGGPVIKAQKESGKVFMVGSQRVSSIVYEKARQLIQSGAIGELNYVEAWWDRNSAMGAWQYSIAPDASADNIDWNRFLGNAPKIPFEPIKLFRWRNYKDYGTGIAGDLFVHLFSGLHFILGCNGPTRIQSTGGLRYWKDGRDVPDVLMGMYDYPATKTTPAFNLMLRSNFIDGSGGGTGFRFVGSEGVLSLDRDITVKKNKMGRPGYGIKSFPQTVQDEYIRQYNEKYPPTRAEMSDPPLLEFKAPEGYDDMNDHLAVFFDAVRNKKAVTEDAVFGFRATAPAILTQQCYYSNKASWWDPENLRVAKPKV
ncbi:MAG: Gfo/Idh/MocA family oxidoreductase [Bacteroidota bacterium]